MLKIEMKQCRFCGIVKGPIDFYRRSMDQSGNRMTVCSECCKSRNKAYRERTRKIAKSGQCQICSDTFKVLVYDHDHNNGKFRGYLCRRCNVMIGMAKDQSRILLNGIRYLIAYYERTMNDNH